MTLRRTTSSLALPFLATLLLLSTVSCRTGDEPNPSTDTPSTAAADTELNEFLDAVFERRVSESPMQQSSLGRQTDQLGQWDDFTDAYAEQQIEKTRNDLEQLRSQIDRDQLSADAQISYDLFELQCQRAIDNHRFHRQFYVVDQFNGQLSSLLTLLQNNHPIRTVDDANDYLSRVQGLETVLSEFARQMDDRAEFGVIPPAFSFPAMLADARAMADGTAVREDFETKLQNLELDQSQKETLTAQVDEALKGPFKRGFAALIDTFERLQPQAEANGNKGVWSLPDGDDFYRNRARNHTTLDLTPDQIHQIGLADVARIHGEMREIQQQVGFEGDLQAFFEFIRTDPGNFYEDSDKGREDFLEDARKQVAEIYEVVDQYFNRVPRAKLEVRRVEPWRENSESIAFYNRPSEDGTRPGIYYANLADMKSVQKYVFGAITYHESVPGHHFQIALAMELEGLPKVRKFGGFGAFTEGWALYAEKLAREMGFYQNPYLDFGRLQNELWRSARLVIDTGIHAKKWTRQEAIDYFRENTPLSDGDVVTEVERFFVNPGQALSYKMGMMKIEELRQRAQEELGDAFDIRDFHEVVIGTGALPLPVLESQVERYIDSKRS